MRKRIIQIEERPSLLESIPLSFQHLFAMFGASVLVPMLFKIDVGTVLLFNGIGTLIYLFLCQGKGHLHVLLSLSAPFTGSTPASLP